MRFFCSLYNHIFRYVRITLDSYKTSADKKQECRFGRRPFNGRFAHEYYSAFSHSFLKVRVRTATVTLSGVHAVIGTRNWRVGHQGGCHLAQRARHPAIAQPHIEESQSNAANGHTVRKPMPSMNSGTTRVSGQWAIREYLSFCHLSKSRL